SLLGLLCTFLALCAFGVCTAQTVITTGMIRGVVSDSSGAVISGANVVLTANGATRATRYTNGSGIFVFLSQPWGRYRLQGSFAGFKQALVQNGDVQVGQTAIVNLPLQPGAGNESVTVNGESPLLRAEDSNLSSVINRGLLDGLPLSGRRFLDFALLMPSASP